VFANFFIAFVLYLYVVYSINLTFVVYEPDKLKPVLYEVINDEIFGQKWPNLLLVILRHHF